MKTGGGPVHAKTGPAPAAGSGAPSLKNSGGTPIIKSYAAFNGPAARRRPSSQRGGMPVAQPATSAICAARRRRMAAAYIGTKERKKRMDRVRFALIGCGVIADFHATAIERIPEATLTGVYNRSRAGAERFVQNRPARIFDTLEALLASEDVDAVCICTPSGLHTAQAVQAMRAGKHVVVEKPMSLSLADADLLIRTAEETGAKVCVISQFRFSPAVQEIRRAMEAGAFGRIVSGSLQMKYYRSHEYYASSGWRGTWALDGGGCLMNQGIHGVDMFRYLMGPVKSVSAIVKTQTRRVEVEDSSVAAIEFAGGAVGTLEGSTTCYPGYPRRLEICGDAGSVVLEEDAILRWDLPIPCSLPVGAGAKNVASSDPKAIDVSGHVRQIGNLVDAVLHGAPLMAPAATGRPPLELILAIYTSARTGRTVTF